MIDQIRAIYNKRIINRLGSLTKEFAYQVRENLAIVLDI